jgi:predicted dehydrogenase
MRFALFGDHPDGLDMARALVESGRHELTVTAGLTGNGDALARWGLKTRSVGDVEEVLADPAIEGVLVASPLSIRSAQVRRALQSERHVLCVHPIDQTPDTAYEAAMIQQDTGRVLLPLLTEFLHPGVARLAALAEAGIGPLGRLDLLEWERWGPPEAVWATASTAELRTSLLGWDVLRTIRGEIAEVSAFAAAEDITPDAPLLLAGRFEQGGLFRVTLFPLRKEMRWRLAAIGTQGQAELTFPAGWPGPGRLTWRDATGAGGEEAWQSWNPWPILVNLFEAAVAERSGRTEETAARPSAIAVYLSTNGRPSWKDEIRSLELDDAARRSVERRRSSTLEYQEATEEVGFKGTMTLVGCGLLWGMLFLVILAAWFPRLGWLIIPLLVIFLGLQLLRWVVPRGERSP